MAAKRLGVTPAELGTVAGKLAELSQKYLSVKSQLLQTATSMGEAWQGSDNQAFVAQITDFCNELEKIGKKLDTASETMKTQKGQYETRLAENLAAAKSLPK